MPILYNIQMLCDKKGISINELEQKLGFGKSTIRKWETVSPTIEKLQAVANFFHVKVDRLLRKPEVKQ